MADQCTSHRNVQFVILSKSSLIKFQCYFINGRKLISLQSSFKVPGYIFPNMKLEDTVVKLHGDKGLTDFSLALQVAELSKIPYCSFNSRIQCYVFYLCWTEVGRTEVCQCLKPAILYTTAVCMTALFVCCSYCSTLYCLE